MSEFVGSILIFALIVAALIAYVRHRRDLAARKEESRYFKRIPKEDNF